VGKNTIGIDTEIDEAGDLVHSDGPQAVSNFEASILRAEEAARLEVALEGELQ
jgi:hypothetical protein